MTRMGDHFWRGLVAGALGLALGGCAAPVADKPAPDKASESGNETAADKGPEAAPVTRKPQPVPPLKASPPGKGKITVGQRPAEKFNVSAENAPVRQLIMGLVADTPYSVVIEPGVQGQVTLNLQGTTVPEAMNLLSRVYGYGVEKAGQRFLVSPADFQTRIFRLNQLNIDRSGKSSMQVSSGSVRQASDDGGGGGEGVIGTQVNSQSKGAFWKQLRQGLATIVGTGGPDGDSAGTGGNRAAGKRKLVVHPEAGVVLVRAKPARLRQVADYLEAIEGRTHRQVVIEAKVLEVQLNKSSQKGINWAAFSEVGSGEIATSQIAPGLANQGSNASAIDPPDPATANADLLPQLQGVDPGGYFSGAVALSNFSAMVSLLETQGDVNVLSSPRVATLNNKKAVIKVGTDEFFVTDVEVENNNTTGTTTTQQTVNPELTPLFSGIALDVTPQISKEGMVTMHVHPSVTDITSQRKNIQLGQAQQLSFNVAQSSVRESDSVVRAQDGQIVVIGGLMKRTRRENDTAVPGLSRLPLLGGLFSSEEDTTRKQELVILLRPDVIYGQRPDPEQQKKLQRQWQDGLTVTEPDSGR